MSPQMSFANDLFRQQEIKKAMRLRRMIQRPCYDRELDLKEHLELEMVRTDVMARMYPLSTN